MPGHSYEGPALDGTVQHLSEAPYWQGEGETIAASDDDQENGDISAENVPTPPADADDRRPDVKGQSTLEDWRWSA
ncbi:MAG: hypothetical protein ABEH56_01995 [Salinirussus sp.]